MSELYEESTQSASFVTACSHFSAATTTASNSSQWPSTQIEPRAIAAAEALGAPRFTSTSSQPGSDSATQIEPRVVAYEAALALKRDREAQKLASKAPTVKQMATLLTRALSDVPDARIIVASTRFPNETSRNSSIIPLSYKSKNRVTFGVIQQAQDVDLILQLPLEEGYTTAVTNIKCQIVYNPGSDDCLLVNRTELQLRLTNFSSSSNLQLSIMEKGSHFIQPGMWRISIAGDDDDDDPEEHHLAEFWLLGRQFDVSIHIAKPSLEAKRGIDDDAEGHISKRQKRSDDFVETASVQPINKTTMEPRPVTTATAMTDARDLTPSSSVRKISDKITVPLLDLADGETAVVRALRDRTDRSQSLSAAKGPARYQLQRVREISATKSAAVFACKHSVVPEPVVAKVLRCNRDSPSSLRTSTSLWKTEKTVLEKLKHRNIVALRAFDGRMLAMYLDPLPPSLDRGQLAQMSLSDMSRILYDISSALVYLKTVPIVHNDIKPRNITYSPRRGAVLIDFGLATETNEWHAGGTPWYLPPDLIYCNSRGSAGDIWALGITMLYLLGRIDYPENTSGWPMFRLRDDKAAMKRMKDWLERISSIRAKLSLSSVNMGTGRNKLEYIVLKMLETESEQRIDAESIISTLDSSTTTPLLVVA
ncbi:Ca2+/calmodulin-dependent protein kinase [Trichoderma chlorosporum]